MLERHFLDAFGFQILTDAAAAKRIPTMVGGHFVEPSLEWPSGIILREFFVHLHKYLGGSVLGVFLSVQRTPTETENRPGKFPIELAPSFEVARPSSGDAFSQFQLV